MDTGIHKSKYHWVDFSWSIKLEVKRDNIATMYNMVPYKLKVMHVEYDTLICFPIIKNRNSYPKEENNCVDESVMVLLYDEHLCENIIAWNTYIRGSGILESRDSVISSLYIGLHIGN